MSVQITQGTQTPIYTKLGQGTEVQVIKLDVGSGTAYADFGGTITEVGNLVKGTITSLQGGTLGVLSSLSAGTVDTIGLLNANAFGTTVTSGTSTLGTIKPAVAGSVIYVTDLIVSVGTNSNVTIASGGTSTPIIGTLSFAANGGLVSNFRTPIFTASGSALVYQQSANAAISITAQGYVK